MTASNAAPIGIRNLHVQRAVGWIRCGWQRLRQAPPLWFGMAGIYLALGVVLEHIPFAGHLLFVLLSPMLLAGALYSLTQTPETVSGPAYVRHIGAAARQLMQAFATEARAYPAVLMGILVVGLVVVLAIAQHFVGTGSFAAEWAAARHGAVQTASAIVRLVASGVLYALLGMALFYAVHRMVYGRREPLAAIADSFTAARQNLRALAVLALIFLIPYIVIAAAFGVARWLGYLALFTVGLAALPTLVLASYCSYRDVFGER